MNADSAAMTARRNGPLAGRARVPGDKSISIRALILGALTVGETRVSGLLEGEDVLNTAQALNALGARIERIGEREWSIRGVGVGGFMTAECDRSLTSLCLYGPVRPVIRSFYRSQAPQSRAIHY